MDISVAFTTGKGKPSRPFVAFDGSCAVTVSGLTVESSTYAYLTTRDGATALANRALVTANVATLNLNTTTMQAFVPVGATAAVPALLTVRRVTTGEIIGIAEVTIAPSANPNADVTRVGIDYATETDVATLQTQIDNIEIGALDITALDAREDAIADATLAAVQEADEDAPKKGTFAQIWTWALAKVQALGYLTGVTTDATLSGAGTVASPLSVVAGGGTGDVVGPDGATADAIALFDSTTGKLIKDSGKAATPSGIGAYRAQTPSSAAEKSGASVAPDFETALTLQWTLTGNLTSFAAATNLADGETGMVLITIGAYSLPADPPSGAYKGAWTVTGTLVRVVVERIGSTYLWSADSLEVVS